MISKEQALLFEEEIKLNLNDYENTHTYRTLKAFTIFKQIIDCAITDEKFYFSGLLAKRLFIYNKYDLHQDLIKKINDYCKYIGKLSTNPSLYCSKDDMESSFRIALKMLEIVTMKIEDSELAQFLALEPILTYTHSKTEKIESFKLVVTTKSKNQNESRIIFGESEELGKVAIYLNKTWQSLWDYILPYSNISVKKVEKQRIKNGYSVFYCNPNTFLVYENDFLVDVTEVASCFQNSGQSEYFAFLNWLSISYSSTPMMIGNIVNNIFDALISNEEIDLDYFIENELSKSPLTYFYLKKYDSQKFGNIRNEVELIFSKLNNSIKYIPKGITYIEPSFISPEYGLQGRLDALVVDTDNTNKKEVIELKSGGFPSTNVPITTGNGVTYSLTTWRNHYVQASCYNLILESVYIGRFGNSAIYYAKDEKRPFRNAPILAGNYQEIIDLRNRIVGLYFSIANKNFSSFKKMVNELSKFPQSYWQKDIDSFESKLNISTSLANEYLKEMLSFIFRELISNKVGKYAETPENAYCNLWLDTNKLNSRKVVNNLILNLDESDFETYYLRFDRTDSKEVTFRQGDQVLIYPITKEGVTLLLNEQILKGVIKLINKKSVVISLRNKLLGTQFLKQYEYWAIEGDFLEHSYKKLPAIIFDFIDDPDFDVKIGIEEQKINDAQFECDYLNTKQTEIVNSAISAQNYYLIQGPPGTGKTSFVLRSLVEYYINYKDGNILLTAYTNRAVDQICTVLKDKTEIKFIRLGSKESSEHSDVLLSEMSGSYNLDDINEKFKDSRVIVSTVSSLLSHQELFTLKDFEIAIVDEAAQILEPYIVNIINKCKKYIMIGDEKQLPAIVSQSNSNYMIENEQLSQIEMNDLSESYFQRMVTNAKRKFWTHSFGMLTHQGRMNYEIMQIVNELFYDGRLLSISNIKSNNNESMNFHNVIAEDVPFINYAEAKYVVDKIRELQVNKETKDMEIGVISPFRSQCALIKNMLPFELVDKIAIDTVERFQGSERDIIFISYAVNKPHHLYNISSSVKIDELEIDRKLNVSITRAKERLYVTGCKEILDKSKIHKKFISILLKEN